MAHHHQTTASPPPRAGGPTLVLAGFALTRLRRRWRLALATYLGLAVACALGTAVALVQTGAADVGLQRTVAGLGAQGRVRIVEYRRSDAEALQMFERQARGTTAATARSLLRPGAAYLSSGDLLPVSRNGVQVQRVPSGVAPRLAAYDGLEQHVRVVQGSFPSRPVPVDVWQVTMSRQAAAQLGLEAGDRYCLADSSGTGACMQVVAIWESTDPASAWWGPESVPDNAVLTAPEAYGGLLRAFPNTQSAASVTLAPDTGAFRQLDLQQALDRLRRLRGAFTVARSDTTIATGLDTALQDYADRFGRAQFAIELLAAQVLLIAFFYLLFASGHALDQQQEQLSIWRSRGWRRSSVFAVLMVEFSLLGLLALPVGVALGLLAAAAAVQAAFGTVPPGLAAGGAGALWQPGALALGLGLCLLAVRAASASRRGLGEGRRLASRPALRPWWQWRQLDLGLALLGAVLLARVPLMAESGGPAAGDPTVLPLTGLALLLLALPALRLLPQAARLAGLARRDVSVALASWQLSRRPLQHSLLALLLLFTIALGVFASGYITTERWNSDDRAAYAAGADLRATYSGDVQMPDTRPVARALKAATALSLVYRGQGQPGQAGLEPWLLGVDPYTFDRVAWSRPDLAAQPQNQVVAMVGQPGAGAYPLPGSPQRLGVWVSSPGLTAEISADVVDAAGRPGELRLGTLDYTGWRYLDAPIAVADGRPRYPLYLRQLSIHVPQLRPAASWPRYPYAGTLALSDLSQTLPGAVQPVVITHFSDTSDQSGWYATRSEGGLSLGQIKATLDELRDGRPTTPLTPDVADGEMTVRPVPPATVLPAVAATATLDRLGIQLDQPFQLTIGAATVAVSVVALAHHFPTFYPEAGQDFLLIDRDPLLTQLCYQGEPHAWPNEIWARTDGSADGADVRLLRGAAGMHEVQSRRELQWAAQTDPLARQLVANLIIGFAAALTLAVAAFGLHFLVAMAGRRGEYAILDANGLPPWTVRRSVTWEQLVLIGFALGIGLALGLLVTWIVLPVLHLDTDLQSTVPPTVVTVDWRLTLAALLAAGGLALAAGVVAAALGRRLQLMDELRALP